MYNIINTFCLPAAVREYIIITVEYGSRTVYTVLVKSDSISPMRGRKREGNRLDITRTASMAPHFKLNNLK